MLAMFGVAAMPLQAEVKSWTRTGNTFHLELTDGSAEIGWVTPSTFRFSRCFTATCLHRRIYDNDEPKVDIAETSDAIELKTEYLKASFTKADLALSLDTFTGAHLLTQSGPRLEGGVRAQREITKDERFFGLGAFDYPKLDLRGATIRSQRPLLLSTAGYGEFHGLPGDYVFNLATGETAHLNTTQWEQFVYFGPEPKEILTEHHNIAPQVPTPRREDLFGTPKNATDIPSANAISQASLSGILAPLVNGKPAWMLWLSTPEWEPYLLTYLYEARDRGLPVIHPAAMQFSEDVEAAKRPDTVLIGDEILGGLGASVYLPRGIWTNWTTNEIRRGRQIAPKGLWARNGSIVPVQRQAVLELHYFPRLGAEFFLSEPGSDAISQFHAAPAGQYMRLQIESLAARDYEWVLHHVSAAAEPQKDWRYDKKRRELRIPIHAKAGSDTITRFALKQPLE
jgi:hypothetical protein